MMAPSLKLIDSHAHITMDQYSLDLNEVFARAQEQGVGHIVNIILGPDPAVVEPALKLSRTYKHISTALGIHPHDANQATPEALKYIENHLAQPAVHIVGEIGLDYYYEHSPREAQKKCFTELLKAALRVKKPISIHTRDAFTDTKTILNEVGIPGRENFVIHCFTGTQLEAAGFLDMGAYISFSGIVSFKKSTELRDVAAYVPLDKILIETDSPFLTPEPYRGKRNEPAYVTRVAETLAAIKGTTVAEVARITRENTITAFRLAI